MIEAAAIDRLKQEGIQRGGLSLEDIQRLLPLDIMTTDELVAVFTQLEDAGIAVDMAPALLANRGRTMNIHEPRPEEAAPASGAAAGSRGELPRVGSAISDEKAVGRRTHPMTRSIPVLAVAAVVVAVVIVLLIVVNL